MSPPRRSWNGTTYVLSLATEVEETTWQLANGGTVTTHAGSRGQLIAVSEGPNRGGYLICDWCGWGTPVRPKVPGKHPHLLRDRDCTGPLQLRALAHRYETNIVAISFDALAAPFAVKDHWRSTLYALLEGVSERLQISRDDIDGTLYPTAGGRTSLVIFDAVPGGAGSAIRIARSFDEVLEAALTLIIHTGRWLPRSVPRIAATAEILASGYDYGPAGGPGAGGFHRPQGSFHRSRGRVRAGQPVSGSALIRCQARVIASAHGQLAAIFQRRRRPPRTRRAAACKTL